METDTALGVRRKRMPWHQLWFSLRGRASRFDYWARFTLLASGLIVLAKLIDFRLGYRENDLGPFDAIVVALLLWPTFAVYVKRCHDRGHSGWFLLWGPLRTALIAAVVATAIGFAIVLIFPSASHSVAGSLVADGGKDILVIPVFAGTVVAMFAVILWPLGALGSWPGTIGPNRYGPDPHPPSQSSPPPQSAPEMSGTVTGITLRERLKRWWILFKTAPSGPMDQASLKAALTKMFQSDAYKSEREAFAAMGLTVEMLQSADFDLDAFCHNLLVKDAIRNAMETDEGRDFVAQAAVLKAGTPEMQRHYQEFVERFASEQTQKLVAMTRNLAR